MPAEPHVPTDTRRVPDRERDRAKTEVTKTAAFAIGDDALRNNQRW